jgi:hypothetical protein
MTRGIFLRLVEGEGGERGCCGFIALTENKLYVCDKFEKDDKT